MYKLYHYPLDLEFFFTRKPTVLDMVGILKRLGYTMDGNKIISDNNGISCEHRTREEFSVKKVRFYDKLKKK